MVMKTVVHSTVVPNLVPVGAMMATDFSEMCMSDWLRF